MVGDLGIARVDRTQHSISEWTPVDGLAPISGDRSDWHHPQYRGEFCVKNIIIAVAIDQKL